MSSPSPSSITPVVGGTSVLSGAGYSNFASVREAQLAQFQQQEFEDVESDTSDEEDNGVTIKDSNINVFQPLPAPLANRNLNRDYSPYYTRAYYNTYETFAKKKAKEQGKDMGVYSPYGGIPEPPNKDYTYYKTVITPNDEMLYIYQNEKTGELVEFNRKGMMQCNKDCPTYFSPVCGTDGVTYDNQCKLNEMVCKTGGKVGFNHPGFCYQGINKKQFVDYKGRGYNLVDSSYITRDNKKYVYVIDGNLNSAIKKVDV